MNNKADFGVLYGQKTTEDALLMTPLMRTLKASPQTGDFIVLTPKDDGARKFLLRVLKPKSTMRIDRPPIGIPAAMSVLAVV